MTRRVTRILLRTLSIVRLSLLSYMCQIKKISRDLRRTPVYSSSFLQVCVAYLNKQKMERNRFAPMKHYANPVFLIRDFPTWYTSHSASRPSPMEIGRRDLGITVLKDMISDTVLTTLTARFKHR